MLVDVAGGKPRPYPVGASPSSYFLPYLLNDRRLADISIIQAFVLAGGGLCTVDNRGFVEWDATKKCFKVRNSCFYWCRHVIKSHGPTCLWDYMLLI